MVNLPVELIAIEAVEAVQFHAIMTSGRTSPLRLTCERNGGEQIDVIAKFVGGQHCTKNSLCSELIAAQLAADLGLPIPPPLLVTWSDDFASSLHDDAAKTILAASSPPAFGSTYFSGGFAILNGARKFSGDEQRQMALAIFFFDALIGNADRSTAKPNMVVRGDQYRIFDHELSFLDHELIVKPPAPWVLGGFNPSLTPRKHIFATPLHKDVAKLDFASLRDTWAGLSDAKIEAYEASLPVAWRTGATVPSFAIKRIKECRSRIEECVTECRRVLDAKT
jgi:hypothetical protein